MSKKLLHIRRVDENHPGKVELVVSEGEKVYVGLVERTHGCDWDDWYRTDTYTHCPETSLGLSELSTKHLVFSTIPFWGDRFPKRLSLRLNCLSDRDTILAEIDLSQMTEYASYKDVPSELVPVMKLTSDADLCEKLSIGYDADQNCCYSKVSLYTRKSFGDDNYPAVNFVDNVVYFQEKAIKSW